MKRKQFSFWIFKNWCVMLYYWVITKLGVKPSTDPIPKDTPYCYLPDVEKNKNKDENDHTYYTKPCKYYKHLGGYRNGCAFLGEITDDCIFDDSCKMCGLKEGFGKDFDESI